jgi:hypothetical protein
MCLLLRISTPHENKPGMKNATPLGYINLPNGMKAIYPMNDIFLNFTFENPAHWEDLRLTVNLFIEAYMRFKTVQNPTSPLKSAP